MTISLLSIKPDTDRLDEMQISAGKPDLYLWKAMSFALA